MERNSSKYGKKFPDIEVSYEFVDAVAMRLVQWPNSYDVLITSNLLVIFDRRGSVISGSMGLMPSASLVLITCMNLFMGLIQKQQEKILQILLLQFYHSQ